MARRRRVEPGVWVRETRTGPVYEVVVRDADGRQRFRTAGPRLTDARKLRDELRGFRARGELPRPRVPLTLGEACDNWLAEKQAAVRESTLEAYKVGARLLGDLRRRRLDHLTPEDLARRVSELRRAGYADSTIAKAVAAARNSFRWAQRRRGWRGENPALLLERAERPAPHTQARRRALTPEELGALLEACDTPRWRCLFELLAVTGARLGEARALRWRDLDLTDPAAATCRIERQLDKHGRERPLKTPASRRVVPLTRALAKRLLELRAQSGWSQPDDYVFVAETGAPLDSANIRRAFNRALKAARFADGRPAFPEVLGARQGPPPTPHSLRHTCATLLIAQGLGPDQVAWHLGHATPTVTLAIYTHELRTHQQREQRRRALEDAYRTLELASVWQASRLPKRQQRETAARIFPAKSNRR